MPEAHLALVVALVSVVALVALLLLGTHRQVDADDTRAPRPLRRASPEPRLSVRARRRNSKGAELAVDVAARGWPAIATVAVLAAAACVLVLERFIR